MNTCDPIKIYPQTSRQGFARLAFLISFFVALSPAFAQELEPRAYSNIPIGINFIAVGYAYTEGGVVFDPSVPLDNAHIKIHGALFAFARSIKIGNMSGKIDMVLPYASLSGSADFQGDRVFREVSGIGDSRFRMSVNFIGAPPLALSEFKEYKQKFIVGGSLQVQVPMSQYDPTRLVNIGTNRVAIRPELGISKTVKRLFLELAVGVAFYSTNNDFYNGKIRSQKPISSIQGHVIYTTKVGIWLAVDGNYYWGGRTTVDGVEGNDLQENSRLGMTLALPVNIHHSLKINYSTGVSTRTGSDFDLLAIAWQYRWSKSMTNKKQG
ncbi:MAG TPA: transporter [Cyclobacteriaceae bacterium]|nr:transporter [Cyclobacteriaceae bacterium]